MAEGRVEITRGLRVLMVSEFFPPVRGGLEVHVDALASELQERGHEVHVATLTSEPAPTQPKVQVHVVSAPVVRRLPHEDPERPYHPPVPDPGARHSLTHIIRAVRPDVIHAHNWLAASLPRRLPAPLVFTVHDASILCPKRTMLRRDNTVCEGPGLGRCGPCAASDLGWGKSMILALATPIGRRLLAPRRVIAISRATASLVSTHFTAPLSVIPPFVPDNLATEATRPPGLPAGPFVMFAGDPGIHKGVDLLLDAWAGPSPPIAELVLAVTRPLRLPLPARARTLSLSRTDVAGAFAAASVVVVPSRWPEALGTVAAEALTVGTPVVASRIGGLPEVVSDSLEGFLFNAGDATEMRRAIDRILGDPELRQRMSLAAKSKARAFSASEVVPRIETVYRSAIDERARTRGAGLV